MHEIIWKHKLKVILHATRNVFDVFFTAVATLIPSFHTALCSNNNQEGLQKLKREHGKGD